LRINLGKSKFFPKGEVDDVEDLAQILGCRVVSLPKTYLGFALGGSYKALLFGMELLRKWNGGWLDGRKCI